MVIIRLARSGAKKNPYYFITVADEDVQEMENSKDLDFSI